MSESRVTEINYTPHCDDESCELGVLHYQCPVCNKEVDDYGSAAVGWYGKDSETRTECPSCGASLVLAGGEV